MPVMKTAAVRAATAGLFAGLTLSSALVAPAAHAAQGDLDCTGAFNIDITPPLTPQRLTSTAHATGLFANCLSLNGRYDNIQSGVIDAYATVSANGLPANICQLLLTFKSNNPAVNTFTWSPNAGISHYTWRISTDPAQGVVLQAHISSGTLAGDTGTAVPVLADPNPDCALNGLKSLTVDLGAFNFD
ncbi:hypothetical protein [Amycolatopsis sp. NPDC049868]|uniref:hypothetical protein n=1 Tax=Amycolatopsis sp. NPDC049868 TaxID=3363934 RepID=UPI0037A88F5A